MATLNPSLAAKTATQAPAATNLYRAVWRWHFYAGLLVLPFLIWLAITGGLYVFKAEIDGYFHRDLKFVSASANAVRPHSELVAAALAAHPGSLRKYRAAATPEDSAEVSVLTTQGEPLSVFVDPYRAQVLGALSDRSSVAWTIRKLHSLKYFGAVARGAIEIAAGWAILLVLTGIYLWWPRGKGRGGVVSVRGQPRQRLFWRDLHAVTGIFVGVALVFLAITGMPWSVVWGAKVNEWANGHNFGYPAGVRVLVPMSQQRLNDVAPTAWSLEQAQLPKSEHKGHAEHDGHHDEPTAATPVSSQAIGLDAAMATFEKLGVAPGFTVNPPKGATGVYSASVYPNNLAQQRVVHLDQYTGQPLIDMGYADYGPLGRWLEWGINVHMGQEFGVPNQALLVVVCVGIVLLCVSAATMWWKRRPAGGLGVPPLPADRRVLYGLLALLALGGVAFPLVGASLLVMLALDCLFNRLPSTFQPIGR